MDFALVWNQLRTRSWMWTFGRGVVERGYLLHKEGSVRVRGVAVLSEREAEVTATVADSKLTPYETTVTLRLNERDQLTLLTLCVCPGGAYCRHAAALLAHACEATAQEDIEARARAAAKEIQAPAPEPEAVPQHRIEYHLQAQPQPVLVLRRTDATQAKDARSSKVMRVPVADPFVTYEGRSELLSMILRSPMQEWTEGSVIHRLERNTQIEQLHLKELMLLGLLPFMEAQPGVMTATPLTHLAVSPNYEVEFWKNFRQRDLRHLEQRGWKIEIADDFGFDVIEIADQAWVTDLAPEADNGTLFSLELGIEVGGTRISLIPIIAEAIAQGLTAADVAENPESPFLFLVPELGDRLISLPGHRLMPILSVLHELFAPTSKRKQKIKVDRLRAAQLASLQGSAFHLPAEIQRLSERLQSFDAVREIEPPKGLKATLRPYQSEGLAWLQFLREFGLHGILADDMGLGKTVQTIAHLLTEMESGRADKPSLILAPTSVVRNWVAEVKKFAPALRVLMLQGESRRERFAYIRDFHIVVTSYPLLIRDIEKLQKQEWHLVVLDEAHGIKNARAKAAQAACTLKARHRLCLTGTPMENHLGELWSLFHFLMPGFLGEQDVFRSVFRNPIEKKQDASAQSRLTARLQPVMLRRTKDVVAKDLPPKTEIINAVELGKEQADLYETIRATVDKRVREAIASQGLEKSQILVLDALLKLRQVCCHPQLLKAESAKQIKTSAKTEFLMEELLPELLEEGRRILLFSQFTTMLAMIEEQLIARGIRFVKLTGETQDRAKPVDEFQKGDVPLFLISLKAGGVGLNLTAADTVIHYDPWWTPAAEAQATDRAHRIGQMKPVFVHKLICQGTIEERIVELQQRKAALVAGLLTGNTDAMRLTNEEVRELLSPL
jgi:superfamily II DNA or RNA helicase